MTAYDKSIFNICRESWFDLTPQSSFVFALIRLAVDRYDKLDDASFLAAREKLYGEAMLAAQMTHGNDIQSIPFNTVYESLEVELNNVLRDIARGAPKSYFDDRITSLREALASLHDRTDFTKQLQQGIKKLEAGASVEEVFIALRPPEPNLDIEADFTKRALAILNAPNSDPLMTGIVDIDHEGGFERGNILVVGGDTGAMKTRISLYLSIQMLIYNPEARCIIFEAEMTKKDVFYIQMGWVMGLSYQEVRKLDTNFIMKYLETRDEQIRSMCERLIILDSSDFSTGEDIYHLVRKYDATFWLVDFLTMMVGGEGGATDVNTKVFALTDKLKECAKRTNTFGIIISQLKKGTVEARKNKVPLLDDMEWSGRLKQIASYVFMVFYPSYYDSQVPSDYFFIREAKSRFSQRIRLYFRAFPSQCNFYVPDEMYLYEMQSWWKDYTVGKKNE